MVQYRKGLRVLWVVVLLPFLSLPSTSRAHCECSGIIGALHCNVYHGGNCAADEGSGSPREELDEPESQVVAVRILDGNASKSLDTVQVGEAFVVEVQFDREPEFQRRTVSIQSLILDGSIRHTVQVTVVKQRQRTVFQSLPITVLAPNK